MAGSMTDAVNRMLRPIAGRVQMMIGRAVIAAIADDQQAQALQIELMADEVQDGVERFQGYGFTSHPHPGAEAVVAFVGGTRSHGIVVQVEDRRYRMKALAEGEVALFDDLGQVVHLKRDRIAIASPMKVTIDAPEIAATGETVTVDADTVTVTAEAAAINATSVGVTAETVSVDATDVTVTTQTAAIGATSATLTAQTVAVDATEVNVTADTVSIDADSVDVTAETATIESGDVRLGGAGGQPVARVGDDVDLGTGKIISGSGVVTAE